jgi:hypothetical protein
MRFSKNFLILTTLILPSIAMSDVACLKEIQTSKKQPSNNEVSTAAWNCLNSLTEDIISGDINAINDGVKLLHHTDAGYTSTIKISLGLALKKEPEHVMINLKGNHSLLIYVCSLNFIEPEINFVKEYYQSTREKLENIKSRYLIKEKDLCIKNMNRSYRLFFIEN